MPQGLTTLITIETSTALFALADKPPVAPGGIEGEPREIIVVTNDAISLIPTDPPRLCVAHRAIRFAADPATRPPYLNRLALSVMLVQGKEIGHPDSVVLRATAPGWVEGFFFSSDRFWPRL